MPGTRRRIATICRRLEKLHGSVEWPEPSEVLDELILTILSQNTSDRNSGAAFEQLRRKFPNWDAVRRAPPSQIARAIRRGGLSKQKAPWIKAILQHIDGERGELSLEFLRDMPAEQAMAYLSEFPGVGPKTAACVLLFACHKPVLPVDTHVHRVSRRLGLIEPNVDAVKAHKQLAMVVPPRLVLEFHILLVRHGRVVCTARSPKCESCPLLDLCPEGQRLEAGGGFAT